MGTKSVRAGDTQFTLHPIPFTKKNIGYCPKVTPKDIDWGKLKERGRENNCIAIRFDVPNSLGGEEKKFEEFCIKAPKDTFAKWNILLDISKSEEEIMGNMHPKTRYNIRLAKRKGVIVKEESNENGIRIFNRLNRETATRQKFYIHPDKYYEEAFKTLSKSGMANILIAYLDHEPLVAYMLFKYQDVLYYPYGASSNKHREFMAANLIMWESIKLGKELNCSLFDMWGAAPTPGESNATPGVKSWWGFTRFKLGYGGEHVKFMDSYDLVLRPFTYRIFNMADALRWKFLKFKKNFK